MSRRPDILLIITDNQAADLLGCYGNTECRTPHLDQLAANGIRFDNAFCPNAMCSPCRASILTGQMPSRHGIHTWIDDRLQDQWPKDWNAIGEFDSLPKRMQALGYETALIGKYHLGLPGTENAGIDHWATMAKGHTISFYNQPVTVNGKTAVHPGHSVDFFCDHAADYLSRPRDKPAFVILALNGPYGHWPAISGAGPAPFGDLYADCPMTSVPREPIAPEAVALYDRVKDMGGRGGPDFSALMRLPNNLDALRNYYAQMSLIDAGLGRVFGAMQTGTQTVFTADHGFSLGHHGFWGHGQATWPSNAYRAAYSVPLIMAGDGLPSRAECSETVSSVDLFATLLGLAGDAPPKDGPSRDLSPLFDAAPGWDNAAFIEQEETRALRTDRWLCVRRFSGGPEGPLPHQLFDLQVDPDETVNLSGKPEHAEAEAALTARLDAFFHTHSDPRFDLWHGGTVKSNTSRPWLWPGLQKGWAPVF